jgi:hypothetical protein
MLKLTALLAVAFAWAIPGPASAQLNNQPYSFGSPGGGVGMSIGGKQAILNQKLEGSTPDNLYRNMDGILVDVRRGPGGVALTKPLRGGRGADGRSANRGPSRAGEFNTFFVKFDGLPFRTDMATSSGAMVDGWTGNVHGLVTAGGNSVDQWTGMVYWLK